LPDAEPWRGLNDPAARLTAGLEALYGWYERNAALAACVLRDAEHHEPTREVTELRLGPPMAACREVLGTGLDDRQRALLGLALSFSTWRTLVRDGGLDRDEAVATMVRAILSAG